MRRVGDFLESMCDKTRECVRVDLSDFAQILQVRFLGVYIDSAKRVKSCLKPTLKLAFLSKMVKTSHE